MPVQIPGNSDNFPANIQAPSAGDPGVASSIQLLVSQFADRTAFLNAFKGSLEDSGSDDDGASKIGACEGPGILVSGTVRSQLDALDRLTSVDGVKRIRIFTNSTDLKSIAAPQNGDLALGPGIGLYVFVTSGLAAAAEPDGLYYFAPNDGTPGRWVHGLALLLNLPLGIAKLDAAAKVPTAQLYKTIVDEKHFRDTGALGSAVSTLLDTASFSDFVLVDGTTKLEVVVPGLSAGDVLLIDGFFWVNRDYADATSNLRLVAGPTAGSRAELPETTTPISALRQKVQFTARYVATTSGSHTVRMQGLTPSGNNLQVVAPSYLRVLRMVP